MGSFTDFLAQAVNKTDITNSLLDSEMSYYNDYGTVLFPSIVINNQTFRGQLEKEAVMNGICAGFAQPPKMCKKLLESDINDPSVLFFPDQEIYEVHYIFNDSFFLIHLSEIIRNTQF